MILIALGANLPGPAGGPQDTLEAALAMLIAKGIAVSRRSHWYRTSPVPASDQPDFINGVAEVETDLGPEALLAVLHEVEAALGRTRRQRWEARVLDLDLLAHGDVQGGSEGAGGLDLPHPRLHQRRFVLVPLVEIAPEWVHPTLNQSARALLAALPEGEQVEILP